MAFARGLLHSPLLALSGMLIWALHFGLIYGVTSLACARGFAQTRVFGVAVLPLSIGVLTLIAALGSLAVIWQALRRRRALAASGDESSLPEFTSVVAALIAGLALVAIIWEALPALMLPPCA